MRHLLVGLSVFALVGCVHVRRTGFDNTTGVTTYCGNRWADEDDVREEAESDRTDCHRLKTLRCGEQQVGAFAQSQTNSYGFTSTTVTPVNGICCDFRCGGD